MKIETTPQDNNQISVSVELDQETIDKYNHKAIRAIAKKAKFPGFRPGKAPNAIVLQTYGKEYIEAEAIEMLLEDIYPEVLKEAELDPAGPGSLDKVELPTLVFSVPLSPSVELCDYHKIRKPYEPEEITDKDVDKVIDDVRRSFATAEPADRAAKKGDQVFFEVSSKFVKPAEGEEADIFKQMPYQIVIGDEDNTGYFYDDFSNELAGLSEGEEKTFKHTYSEDAKIESLQGKQVEFNVKVQSVKALVLPDVDDAFAEQVGKFESVESMRENVLNRMQERNISEYDDQYLSELIDEIVETSTIKYAEYTLKEEIDEIIESLKDDLKNQEMDLDDYLASRDMDLEKFIEEEARPAAIKRLNSSLVLRQIAEEEKLKLDNKELQQAVLQTLMEFDAYSGDDMFKVKQKRDSLTQAITMDTANRLFNEQLMTLLKDIASGELEKREKQAAKEAKAKAKAEAKAKKEAEAAAAIEAEEKPAAEAETEPEVQTGEAVETPAAEEKTEE
ncbi:MAG: trigger factor [Anaerolineaceae bacterium]|nr:trigger factor [Anaerolineaceae bacterium]